jgi:hypothetical protein
MHHEPELDLPERDVADFDVAGLDLPQVHADELFNVAAPPTRPDAGYEAFASLRDTNHAFGPMPPAQAPHDERLSHGWWDAARWPDRQHAFSA